MKISEKARFVKAKKVWKACRTPRLSTCNAVDGVYEDFVPIIWAINLADEKDGLVTYLLSKMKSIKFLGTIYILKSVPPELTALSRVFQWGTHSHLHYWQANEDSTRRNPYHPTSGWCSGEWTVWHLSVSKQWPRDKSSSQPSDEVHTSPEGEHWL